MARTPGANGRSRSRWSSRCFSTAPTDAAKSSPGPPSTGADGHLSPDTRAPGGACPLRHLLPQQRARPATAVLRQHVDLAPADVEVLGERQLELGHPHQGITIAGLERGCGGRTLLGSVTVSLERVEGLEQRMRPVRPRRTVHHLVPRASGGRI